MENYIVEWLNLLFRWLHFITGAAWIGTSFYFNWLNHNLRPPEEGQVKREGVDGELFAVHGGHFYQVSKYAGAPKVLPKTLHWFKWEAYFTWITGVCMLFIVYYWNSKLYLIPAGSELTPFQGISIGIGCLIGGWIAYDLLCKSPLAKNPTLFAAVGFTLMTGAAYGLTQVFGPRAAYIHVGAMLGTMMAANVFFVMIPNQRKMVDAMIAGDIPDTTLGDQGALRSFHNNYLTLPVLFIMISNHFAGTTWGHTHNWMILAALSLIGASARHYFNLKHKGKHKQWILPAAALAMVALAFVARPQPAVSNAQTSSVTYRDIHPIIVQRCQPCHSAKPSYPGFTAPPKGVVYDTPENIQILAQKIKMQAVTTIVMPPGNITEITDAERALLGAWVDAGAPIPSP